MTEDALALLKEITAQPDDDLPRLVFADWLDENGFVDYAEFIRLQVERARVGGEPSARERELYGAKAGLWLQFLPVGFREGIEFRRGFPYRVRCDAETLFSPDLPPLFVPVEEMEVVVSQLWVEMQDVMPPPLSLPLRRLTVRCEPWLGHALNGHLRRFGPYPRLEHLQIQDTAYSDRGVRGLTPDLGFPAITSLDLSYCGINDDGAEALAESAWVGKLTELRLIGNHISTDRLEWLRYRFGPALVE
jgi:uncharacterized protein (TIGR02996 family)